MLCYDYRNMWTDMNCNKDKTQDFKRKFYEEIRKRFNLKHNSADFLFLDRTCFNGLIRYNLKG